MAIVGQQPDHGVRIVVERPPAGGPPWRYAGDAMVEDATFPVVATVDADGGVAVEVSAEAPGTVSDRVRLIVKAAWKLARQEGLAPPRRISRWRADP